MEQETPIEHVRLVDGIRVIDRPRVALIRTDPVAIVFLLGFSLALGLGIAFVLTHTNLGKRELPIMPVVQTQTPVTPPVAVAPATLSLERWNQQVVIPAEWKPAKLSTTLPQNFGEAEHVYAIAGTTCHVAYAAFTPPSDEATYPRTADNTRLVRDETLVAQIERRIAATTYATDTPSTQAADAPFVAHEIALSYQPLYYDNGSGDTTRNAWVLFSADETPLDSRCFAEFVTFMRSVEPYYPSRTLTRRDEGLLYVEEQENAGSMLLFRDRDTNNASVVATLDSGAIFKPTYVDGSLYYVGTEGTLKRYTLFETDGPQTIPLPLGAEDSVHDFVVAGETITYLSGIWCRTDETSCELTLAEYDIANTTTTQLASGVSEPRITDNAPALTMVMSLDTTNGAVSAGPEQFAGSALDRVAIATY